MNIMNKFDKLLEERDKYNVLMYQVLNGSHHLKKKWEKIVYPISAEQKAKDLFLFKYYEHRYNSVCKEIESNYWYNADDVNSFYEKVLT